MRVSGVKWNDHAVWLLAGFLCTNATACRAVLGLERPKERPDGGSGAGGTSGTSGTSAGVSGDSAGAGNGGASGGQTGGNAGDAGSSGVNSAGAGNGGASGDAGAGGSAGSVSGSAGDAGTTAGGAAGTTAGSAGAAGNTGGAGAGGAGAGGAGAGGAGAGGAGAGGAGAGGAGGSGGAAVCGDGTIGSGETCDDGNQVALDGCSPSCKTEPGWTCTGTGAASCKEICGDDLVVGKELLAGHCDDHNASAQDGCASCLVEAGWVCTGQPSACQHTCVDGILQGQEQCDDQNATAGDGCFACRAEPGFDCKTAKTCVRPVQWGTNSADGQVYLGFPYAAGQQNVVGTTSGTFAGQSSAGGSDIFYSRIAADGSVLCSSQFGTGAADVVAGSFSVYPRAVFGQTTGIFSGKTNQGNTDAFLLWWDVAPSASVPCPPLTSVVEWGTMGFETVRGASNCYGGDSCSELYVVGGTTGTFPGQTPAGMSDAFVSRVNLATTTTIQWGTNSFDEAKGVSVPIYGQDPVEIIVAGNTDGAFPGNTNKGGRDAFLTVVSPYLDPITSSATVQWGTMLTEDVAGISEEDLTQGGLTHVVYVVGSTTGAFAGSNLGGKDVFLSRISVASTNLPTISWTVQFGTSGDDVPASVYVDPIGTVWIAGSTTGAFPGEVASGGQDFFLSKLDKTGKVLSTRQWGTAQDDIASRGGPSDPSAGGAMYVTGTTTGAIPGKTNAGGTDALLVLFP